MVASLDKVLNYESVKTFIPDYTDIEVYPDIEQYYLEEYDYGLDKVLFNEIFNTIFDNPNWADSKLYFLLQAYFSYIKNDVAFEADNQLEFFDLFFLKQVTLDVVESKTDPVERDQFNKYYERFYEIFNNFVNYLSDYLTLIEGNAEIQNSLKKDLLVYYGKKIYRARGRQLGVQYLYNILNPITILNKYTGEQIKNNIEIEMLQWGEFAISLPEDQKDKEPYIYRLNLRNVSDSGIKFSIFNIIKNILHPSGYRALISDYIQFNLVLKLHTKMFMVSQKSSSYRDIVNVSSSEGSYITTYSSTYGSTIDLAHTVHYTLNDGETGISTDFGTPDLDYALV